MSNDRVVALFSWCTEEVCRYAARKIGYLENFKIEVAGRVVEVKFEYCVWTQDKIIKGYVENGEPL